jgi:hypothetical protein
MTTGESSSYLMLFISEKVQHQCFATVSTTYMNDYWRVLKLSDALHFRKGSASMLQLEY